MTTPIERLRELHQLWDMPEKPNVHACAECADPWPCDTIAALDALDALEAENARLREQADALADALDKALFFAGERTSKLAQTRLSASRLALAAYREADNAN